MRGNEDTVFQRIGKVGVWFSIPMRGNEQDRRVGDYQLPPGFSIPMRGMRRVSGARAARPLRVLDPHEG